jgi:hypothetical protein
MGICSIFSIERNNESLERSPMANPHHLAILKRGITEWNKWRQQSPNVVPDLDSADLAAITTDFSSIDFRNVSLKKAKLSGVSLADAVLYDAKLNEAELVDASVRGADLRGADFGGAVVDGIRYDRKMKCLGTRVDDCVGSQRFKRAVIEADYIEAFTFEHPVISKFWSLTSDYSRSPFRIGLIGLIIIGIFATVYYAWPSLLHWPGAVCGESRPSNLWFAPIYYSVVTFTTLGYGDMYPVTTSGEVLATCEVVVGYVWLGYLVSVLASRSLARA